MISGIYKKKNAFNGRVRVDFVKICWFHASYYKAASCCKAEAGLLNGGVDLDFVFAHF